MDGSYYLSLIIFWVFAKGGVLYFHSGYHLKNFRNKKSCLRISRFDEKKIRRREQTIIFHYFHDDDNTVFLCVFWVALPVSSSSNSWKFICLFFVLFVPFYIFPFFKPFFLFFSPLFVESFPLVFSSHHSKHYRPRATVKTTSCHGPVQSAHMKMWHNILLVLFVTRKNLCDYIRWCTKIKTKWSSSAIPKNPKKKEKVTKKQKAPPPFPPPPFPPPFSAKQTRALHLRITCNWKDWQKQIL